MKLYQRAFRKFFVTLGLIGDELSLETVLRRCRNRGAVPATIIDVGASNGCWSLRTKKIFPEASFFLVEAQKEHEAALVRVRKSTKGLDFMIAAAGDRDGEVYFDTADLFGGVASHVPLATASRTVPMRRIDSIVAERNLHPPFLLKLDTHGFEVPILEGARATLAQTSAIVVETYNFKIEKQSLRFHEMCLYMEESGFRCIDICDPMHRPSDKAFWQIDLIFIPSTSPVFDSNSYR